MTKTKIGCLDEADPSVKGMPHPAETNWGVRSDLTYDLKHRSHPRRLADQQIVDQADEPDILQPRAQTEQPAPSGSLYQRIGNRLKRYKSIH